MPIADEREVRHGRARRGGRRRDRLPGGGQAVRRRDRAQDRARPRAAAARRRAPPSRPPRRELLGEGDAGRRSRSTLLVAPMVSGNRELIAGVVRDPQFGANVMLGVGGDPRRGRSPTSCSGRSRSPRVDAEEMIDAARARSSCSVRSAARQPVDRDALVAVLVGLSAAADGAARHRQHRRQPADRRAPTACRSRSTRSSRSPAEAAGRPPAAARPRPTDEQFRALFEPRGVLVAGASTHPGKFGFVSLHNILAGGYAGAVLRHQPAGRGGARHPAPSPTSPSCPTARSTSCSCARRRRPTRPCCARARRRASRPRSSPAPATARPATKGGGRGTSWSRSPTSSGMLLAGPNGQGVVSTPANLCAQIVAPYPPAGPHRRRQPERQLRQQLPQLRPPDRRRASAARCRPATPRRSRPPTTSTGTPTTPATAVSLAYVEGIVDGRALLERFASVAARKPLVVVKGGATEGGRAGRRQPHRRARRRRQGLRRRLPPGRRHPRRHRRGGVRGRSDVRHAAAAGGPERRRAHHRRRLGRRHERRDPPRGPAAR